MQWSSFHEPGVMAAVTRPYFFRFPFALPLVGGSAREPALHVLCTADSTHILSYLPRQRVIILIFCDSFCYPIQNKISSFLTFILIIFKGKIWKSFGHYCIWLELCDSLGYIQFMDVLYSQKTCQVSSLANVYGFNIIAIGRGRVFHQSPASGFALLLGLFTVLGRGMLGGLASSFNLATELSFVVVACMIWWWQIDSILESECCQFLYCKFIVLSWFCQCFSLCR